jgi:heat shock protein HslJ
MRKLLLVTSAVMLLAASCGDSDGEDAAVETGDLAGTSWELATVDGSAIAVAGESWITFLDDGTVNGNGACNTFTGPYEQDGASLSIGPLASTLRLCDGEGRSDQETAFFGALDATASFRTVDGDLHLEDADGGTVAVLAPAERPTGLAGSWTVTSYNNGAGGAVSVIEGTELTVVFGEDGTVSGSSGCNTYTGGYVVEGDTVSIGALASTRKACADPEGVMDQETQFLAALQSAATWSQGAGTVDLRTAEDEIAVLLTSSS